MSARAAVRGWASTARNSREARRKTRVEWLYRGMLGDVFRLGGCRVARHPGRRHCRWELCFALGVAWLFLRRSLASVPSRIEQLLQYVLGACKKQLSDEHQRGCIRPETTEAFHAKHATQIP